MLTEQAFTDMKIFLDKTISHAVVTMNGVPKMYDITRREVLKDGRVAIYIQITPESSTTVTIQKVQLYNVSNQLWASKDERIKIDAVQEGVLYRFTFKFLEQEV